MSEPIAAKRVIEAIPLNLKAVLDWCDKNRPDLRPVIWAQRDVEGFILLMTVGFEAGRHFQKDRPDYPLDAPHLYLQDATPQAESGFITTIKSCARCGGDHENLMFLPVANSQVFSYYATCPTNRQPILMKMEDEEKA